MAVTKVQAAAREGGVVVNDLKVVGEQGSAIASITDSTTGTAGDTVNDTTSSVKDDIASLAAKVNAVLAVLRAHGLIATAE